MSGIVLVTVPIGDEQDITLKAKSLIEQSVNIYAEDTRVFKELCKRLAIDYSAKKIRSFHDHSGAGAIGLILDLAQSETCLFVSDAGSPIISDPAYPLVLKAIEKDISVTNAAGISAVLSALELSGLPPIPFHFHGFFGRDKGKITQELDQIAQQYGTHIFFEGKSRVMSTLELVGKRFPTSQICLCRELTKQFQSIHRFKGEEFSQIKESITIKGEFVVLIGNSVKAAKSSSTQETLDLAQEIITSGAKPKKLAKLLALITNTPSKDIYKKISGTRQ
jgi:16S rRNA (cytidine1402-2'-O)-methyltransferase